MGYQISIIVQLCFTFLSLLMASSNAFLSPSASTIPQRTNNYNYPYYPSASDSESQLFNTRGGSGKKRQQAPTSTAYNTEEHETPKWKQTVEAKRTPLGHVVPKDSMTRQQLKNPGGKSIRPQGQFTDGHPRKTKGAPPLKILGGTCKGRRLNSPLVHLRPMMGKVREACFSTLIYMELYKPPTGAATSALCRHLDIFSGSGSVGLESLSRGATHCTFVDLAQNCCETSQSNLELCGFQDKGLVVCADAMEMLQNPVSAMSKAGIPVTEPPQPYQIVTICPPYEEVVYGDLIDAVANSKLVTDDTIVLIEYPIELGCLPHVYDLKSGGKMIGLRNRKYGRTVIAFYIINPTGKLEAAESRPEEFVSLN